MAVAATLPLEIWSVVLGLIWPTHLLFPLMRVCKVWRDNIVAHPHYWRHVALFKTSPKAFAAFNLRLYRAQPRPITVVVYVTESCPDLRHAFTGITAHLHHIERLGVTVHRDEAEALMQVLHAGAPVLTSLAICVYLNPKAFGSPLLHALKEVPELSAHALYGAPMLSYLDLTNVLLPADMQSHVFPTVRELRLEYRDCAEPVVIRDLLSSFPSTRRLRIGVGVGLTGAEASSYQTWNDVEFVHFANMDAPSAVHTAGMSRVPDIELLDLACDAITTLLDHEGSPLRLEVEDRDSSTIVAHFVQPHAQRRRSMKLFRCMAPFGSPEWSAYNNAYKMLGLPRLMARVSSLTISLASWEAVGSSLAPLAAATRLVVVFPPTVLEGCVWAVGHVALSTPVLRTLAFDSEARHLIHIADVRRFMDSALPEAPRPLALRLLGGMSIHGSLGPDFILGDALNE